jgi:hypothetical protein
MTAASSARRERNRDMRVRILESVSEHGRLPTTFGRDEALNMEAVAVELRDEGVIACANRRWYRRQRIAWSGR